MHSKGTVFQQSKCQDSVGGVSSMEASDLELKYGKPESTFEKVVVVRSSPKRFSQTVRFNETVQKKI